METFESAGPRRYMIPSWIPKEATPKIFPAMVTAMRGVEAVAKTQKNRDQNYSFRGIDQVYSMIHAVLAEAGITTAPIVHDREVGDRATKSGGSMQHVRLRVSYWFTAEDGSAMEVGPIWSEALDTSDKAYNKALAFAHKYALLQVFCIPTEDTAEGDRETIDRGQSPQASEGPPRSSANVEPIGKETAAKIYETFYGFGVTREQIHRKLSCADVADVPSSALGMIKSWREAITTDKREASRIFGGTGPAARTAQAGA